MGRLVVRSSSDYERICGLPRRSPDYDRYEQAAVPLSRALLNDSGRKIFDRIMKLPEAQRTIEFDNWAERHCPLLLQADQVWPLLEFIELGRLYLHGPVGLGKTLLTLLLAAIAAELYGATRACLLVKGGGRDQTVDDLAKLRVAWCAPARLDIVSYDVMQRRENVFRFCGCPACANDPSYVHKGKQLKPNPLIADESHSLNSPKNVVHKRIDRLKKRHPETIFIGMSGTTLTAEPLDDYGPMTWSLGGYAPAPRAFITRKHWMLALNKKLRYEDERADPGVLLEFDDADDADAVSDDFEIARRKYARRRAETPGCVVITRPSCDLPITIEVRSTGPDNDLNQAFKIFRERDQTPDGLPIGDPLERFRVGNQLGCGFHTRWKVQPPDEWIEARTDWNLFMRAAVKKSQYCGHPLDSEGAVMKRYPDSPELEVWREAKAAFTPETIARCVSMGFVREAAALMASLSPCLVWTPHKWLGNTLANVSGVPYFASKGRTAGGMRIDRYHPGRSAILSMKANRTQRNLQGWSRNIILGAEASARNNEQMLGRTHRRNQKKTVEIIFLAGCGEHVRSVHNAFARADGVQEFTSQQKLLTADVTWSTGTAIKTGMTSGDAACRWRQ